MIFDARYVLEAPLGEGGMGTVYKAQDRLTGKTIALKRVLHSAEELLFSSGNTGDGLDVALAKEFQTLAALRHPNIISVLDYSFDDQQRPYFTMDYLADAPNILEAAENQPLSTKIDLVIQLLHALNYLHRRGILHRDLKPANVLVDNGKVKLLDFGLAIETQINTEITGTLAYLAPEVLQGEPVSIASDLYAVGVMLYEILVGKHPFNLRNLQVLVSDILSTPPNLAAIAQSTGYDYYGAHHPIESDLTRPLDEQLNATMRRSLDRVEPDMSAIPQTQLAAIVGKLLNKRPLERYSNAMDTLQALHTTIHNDQPVEPQEVRESFLQAAKFIGREPELEKLERSLRDLLRKKKGTAWLIGGESGVGKSRLVDELRIRALVKGAQVLTGQGISEGGKPYHFWREPLRRLVLQTELTDLDAAILKPLVPDIETLIGHEIEAIDEMDGNDAKKRLIDTIIRVFSRQTRPIVLILEDLQWTHESLEVLKGLTELVEQKPLLIIGTFRPELRPDMDIELPKMKSMMLERLSQREIASLSYSMLGVIGRREELVDFLQRQTEGNAFFLVEVVRTLAAGVQRLEDIGSVTLPQELFSVGIQTIIEQRLSRIKPLSRPLLKLAAAAGRYFDLRVLEKVAPNLNIDLWLVECSNAAVLELHDGKWRFAHDRLRQAVLDNIGERDLPALHRQVAVAMEALYPEEIEEQAHVLANHWRLAKDPAKERFYSFIAADQKYKLGNFRQAHDYYTRIFQLLEQEGASRNLPERVRALYELGRIKRWVGDSDYKEAQPYFDQAIELALSLNHEEYIGKLFIQFSGIEVRRGNYPQALQYATAGLAMMEKLDMPRETGQAHNAVANVYFRMSDYEKVQEHLLKSLTYHERVDYQMGIASVAQNLGATQWSLGQKQAALANQLKALEAYRRMGARHCIATLLTNLATIYSDLGDYANARTHYQEALELAVETQSKRMVFEVISSLGWLNIRLGNYGEAEHQLRESLIAYEETEDAEGVARMFNDLGDLAFVQGKIAQALESHQRGVERARRADEKWQLSNGLRGLAGDLVMLGRYPEAANAIKESAAIGMETDAPSLVMEAGYVLAQLCLKQEHWADAAKILHVITTQEGLEHYILQKALADQASLPPEFTITSETPTDTGILIAEILQSLVS